MRAADDRRHVVLAERFEGDVAQYDHLVVTLDLLERTAQVVPGVALISREPVPVGVHHPFRRFAQTLAAGILSRPAKQRAYRRLRAGPGYLAFILRHRFLPAGASGRALD